jgi:hypothetical protein
LTELENRVSAVEVERAQRERSERNGNATPRLSEADLGQWMDATMTAQSRDRVYTSEVKEQFKVSLTYAPGVKLEDVDCGSRFCRATFTQPDGAPPTLRQVIGASPFMTEGFTLGDADGRMAIYFVRAGETLDALRKEASVELLPQ